MIIIWPSVFIHPYGIYDPRMRTIQESDGILRNSEEWLKLADAAFFGWNLKGTQRLWGCWFMIVIWLSVYIHPYVIYDPQIRTTIQESDS